MAKLGFVALVLIFGLCTFVAGVLAPANIATPVAETAQSFYEQYGKPLLGATEDSIAKLEQASVTAIDYQQLTAPKGNDPVGIQVGLFSSTNEANAIQASVKQLNIDSTLQSVMVAQELTWVLVAAGPYPTADIARTDMAKLQKRFGSSRTLSVINWPTP